MKYIKYLTLCLLVALVASCSDKDVTYQMTKVDTKTKAFVQIAYVAPVRNIAANYIYYVDLNGVEYGNNGSTFLATYNFIPSGSTSRYYTVDAGSITIQLKDKNKAAVYNNQATGLEAGKRYIVFVYDTNAAPKVVETPDFPTFPGTAATADKCGMRLYNFVYEADGTPMTDKIQYAFRNDSTKEYEPVGTPIAFGEATSYFTPTVKKTVFNSSGYQTRYNTILRIDATTGESKGQLTYTNSNGNTATFTDYWTLYIGRIYHHVAAGNLSSATVPLKVTNFTAY